MMTKYKYNIYNLRAKTFKKWFIKYFIYQRENILEIYTEETWKFCTFYKWYNLYCKENDYDNILKYNKIFEKINNKNINYYLKKFNHILVDDHFLKAMICYIRKKLPWYNKYLKNLKKDFF